MNIIIFAYYSGGVTAKAKCYAEASLLMGYIQGEGRSQATLFPMVLDDFVPEDHCVPCDRCIRRKTSDVGAGI
jgi:hypothetical protein